MAAINFHDVNGALPPGGSDAPSGASSLVWLMQFSEQTSVFNAFNLSLDVTVAPENFTARDVNVPIYLCPSDPSSGSWPDSSPYTGQADGAIGRSNYYGNLGINGWTFESSGQFFKRADQLGIFAIGSATRISDIADGTSNTALYAEVKRGAYPGTDALDVTLLSDPDWVWTQDPTSDPYCLIPPAACDVPPFTFGTLGITGLLYQNGSLQLAFLYTHTRPPNYQGRDCVQFPFLDRAHVASRSYHPGGVNIALSDGSARFVKGTVALSVWQAIGTRRAGDILASSSY